MPIFGLVWVASWVSCFFASTPSLLKTPYHLASILQNPLVSASLKLPGQLFSFSPPPPSLATLTFNARSSVDTVSEGSLSSDSDRFTTTNDWSFAPLSLSPWVLESSRFSFSRSAIELQPAAVPPQDATLSWLDRLKNVLFRSQSRYTKLLSEVMKLAHSQQVKGKTEPPFTRATQEFAVPTFSHHLNLFHQGFSGVTVASPPAHDAFTIVPIWGNPESPPELPSVLEARFEDCPLVNPNATVVTRGSQRAFQIRFHDRVIAAAPEQWLAEQLVQELRQILDRVNLQADQVEPTTVEGMPAAELEINHPADNRLLFTVDQEFAKAWGCDPELLAMDWVNNLRRAVDQPPLPFAVAQAKLYGLQDSNKKMTGVASWYGNDFHGLQTATGEIYNQHAFTAAHRFLPFDTYLKVKNLHNGRSVIVRINDRGPYVGNRTLDLSLAAARSLGSETIGLVPIEAIVMQSPPSSASKRLARVNNTP